MESAKKIIEINGVKMELDLRQARRIDTLQIGDRVKVLVKQYSDYKVHAGTVIGFEPFENLPTILIAYLDAGYSNCDIKFLSFNSQTKEIEVVKSIDDDQLDIDKTGLLAQFDREIERKAAEVADIKAKKDYFVKKFASYWEGVAVKVYGVQLS